MCYHKNCLRACVIKCLSSDKLVSCYEFDVEGIRTESTREISEIEFDMLSKGFVYNVLTSFQRDDLDSFIDSLEGDNYEQRDFQVYFVTNTNEQYSTSIQETLLDHTVLMTQPVEDVKGMRKTKVTDVDILLNFSIKFYKYH